MSTTQECAKELECCLHLPKDMVTLRRIFLSILRLHFSDPGHYGVYQDELGCFYYSSDPEKASTLHVALMHTVDPKKIGPLPAIYVGISSATFEKQAIDNYQSVSADGATSIFTNLCQAAVKISHLARSADQAILLAENTLSVMAGMRPQLMEVFSFLMFDIQQITEPKIQEKGSDTAYIVDVNVSLAFNFLMSCNIESHPLARIGLDLTPEAGI
jgi:hypothetical protein